MTVPTIVVPCFNEERRLDADALVTLAGTGRVRLLLVNDGSTDGTRAVLHALAERAEGIGTIDLSVNKGKAEAVRRGLLGALEGGAEVVGYYDADLATPPDELLRLVAVLDDRPDLSVVMASRVRLLGRSIDRSPVRHYLGRVFGTLASLTLGLPVYDTQCGAKLFRVRPALVEALQRPFRSSWVFDVELLGRLTRATEEPLAESELEEVPLRTWHDMPGSKLGLSDMARAFADLAFVYGELRKP